MTVEEAKAWLECMEFEVTPKTQRALVIATDALNMQIKMKNVCDGSCADCPYSNPHHANKCMNEFIVKFK